MYRIELAPGEETVFRTIEELAIGVRNGLVTPRSRIYHNATQKWLPIEFHPHYKKALALPASRVAEATAQKPAGRPRLDTLTFAVVPTATGAASEPVTEAVTEPVTEPITDAAATQSSTIATRSPEPQARKRAHAERGQATGPRGERAAVEPESGEQEARKHRVAEQSTAVHRIEKLPAVEVPVAEQPSPEQPVAQHPIAQHPIAPCPVADQPVAHQPVAQAPVVDRPMVAPRAADPFLADHAAPVHLPPTSRAATMHQPPGRPQGEPPARFSSSYRPDSYLPPSGRIVADDSYMAVAPGAATTPQSGFEPRVETRPIKAAPADRPREVEPLQLPTIAYPEITPADEPVAERAGSTRGRRPLQVAVAMLVLAAGGYLAKSLYSPVRGNAVAPAAARPALPEDSTTAAAGGSAGTSQTGPAQVRNAVAAAPSPSRPAAGLPAAPASSGFAAALEPRALTTGPAPNLPAGPGASVSPAASGTDSTAGPTAIAPPPAQMDIDVPALPSDVRMVPAPSAKSDSAMKRILRAVNGGRDARQP